MEATASVLRSRRLFNGQYVTNQHHRDPKLVIQINSNREKLRPEEAYRLRVPGAAGQFARQPSLAFAWIIA